MRELHSESIPFLVLVQASRLAVTNDPAYPDLAVGQLKNEISLASGFYGTA
jgi:hypothetical protein